MRPKLPDSVLHVIENRIALGFIILIVFVLLYVSLVRYPIDLITIYLGIDCSQQEVLLLVSLQCFEVTKAVTNRNRMKTVPILIVDVN